MKQVSTADIITPCIFCGRGEPTAYICSTCVQKLLSLPIPKVKQLISKVKSTDVDRLTFLDRYIASIKDDDAPSGRKFTGIPRR